MSQKPADRPAMILPLNLEVAMSHQEIADLLGVHRSYVQQLEKSALAKMRKAAKRWGLKWGDVL